MSKPILSVEYCHVTFGQDPSEDIACANAVTAQVLAGFSDQYEIWPYVMIDDLRSEDKISESFVTDLVNGLEVKPRSVYLESSFVFPGEEVFAKIKDQHLIEGEEGRWLKRVKDSYGSTTDFVVSWKDKLDLVNFSCPTLVTTSYLFRLGVLPTKDIPVFWGDALQPATKLLNILSSKYMQTEANAQSLLNSYAQGTSDKISTFFY